MSPTTSICQHRQGSRTNSCDDAITNFTPAKWLASTGQAGHLFDGLTYLLQAAQEWKLQQELNLNAPGYQAQVYSMDSVFLRARSLFEFFVGTSPRTYCHAQCLFGLSSQLTYLKYTDPDPSTGVSWEDLLHVGSIHFKNRDNPVQLLALDGTSKDLNQMVVDFAKGILDVWSGFEAELRTQGHTTLLTMAEACREKAKEDARAVVEHVADRAPVYSVNSSKTLTTLF